MNITKLLPIFTVCVLFAGECVAEHPDSCLMKIEQNQLYIKDAAAKYKISSEVLSAIIFVERQLNYDWSDDALDIILAKTGHNSSIGFCQVKLKTAYWIEVQLNDSSSVFWPGKQYTNILSVSQSPKELIAKLENDSLNIIFAAAYLRLIQSRWERAGDQIDDRADILGTLYSTGLFNPDGTERLPRSNPEANMFGRKVKEALHLFQDY